MNEKVVNDLNQMLPPELELAKKFIDELIDTKSKDRLTNLEYLNRKKNNECPIDRKHHIKKNGHKNGTQRYWCYDCRKYFSITESTILKSSKITYIQLKKILKCMYDYKSLKETVLEIDMTPTSVFELEIRIFDALDQIYSNRKLQGIIQVDEKYIRTSFKGTPKDKMPRKSRHSGSSNLISGISNDQVCVIVAIDEFDEMIIKVVGNGQSTTKMISNALKN